MASNSSHVAKMSSCHEDFVFNEQTSLKREFQVLNVPLNVDGQWTFNEAKTGAFDEDIIAHSMAPLNGKLLIICGLFNSPLCSPNAKA